MANEEFLQIVVFCGDGYQRIDIEDLELEFI